MASNLKDAVLSPFAGASDGDTFSAVVTLRRQIRGHLHLDYRAASCKVSTLPNTASAVLANFNDYERDIVGKGAVSPRSHAFEDRLTHVR